MQDLGQWARERGLNILLLQEPYVFNGGVRGLPMGMKVYLDTKGQSAIIINNGKDVQSVCVM